MSINNGRSISYKIVLFLLTVLTSYSVVGIFTSNTPLLDFSKFTNMSMIFVLVVIIFLSFELEQHKFFKYLTVITLVNILMTGLIYHFIVNGITNFMTDSINSHIKHTVIPVLYPIFYFKYLKDSVRVKDFWITLVFPLLYFLFFILFGELLNYYPYAFINPNAGSNTLTSVLLFSLLVLLPIIALFTLLLIYLKNLVEKKRNQ